MPNRQKTATRGRPALREVLGRLDDEVAILHERLGGLPRAVEADHILRAIWIDDVHNSTAIEGNTMTRAQVANLVERGRASGTLFESAEVEAYARAADWVYRSASEFEGVPLDVVREIHSRVVGLPWQFDPPATRDRPGSWRSGSVRVGNLRVSMPVSVPADMDEWSRSTQDLAGHHPVVHASVHHARLERIHPFVDGNGRVGRLVLNFMLVQCAYPPAVILARRRMQYLRALRTADNGNPNALAELVARSVGDALNRFLIPRLAGSARLVPLSALAAQSDYSPAYLRRLVREARLRAYKEGKLWLSSIDFLDEYVRSKDPRGRPRVGSAT